MKKTYLVLIGCIIAFISVLQVHAQTDVTSLIVNPEFDDATLTNGAPTGWTKVGNGTSKISTVAKGDGSVILAGQNHWQIWGGPFTCEVYQKITGVPKGRYKLSAGFYGTFNDSIYLYANNGKKQFTSGTSNTYSVECIVTDDTLRIGLKVFAGTIFELDHFKLTYYDQSALVTTLTQEKTLAESMLSKRMQNSLLTELNASISQAQTALGEQPSVEAHLNDAITRISAAIAAANISITSYTSLKTVIDSAQIVYGAGAGISATTLQNAIGAAQSSYNNLEITSTQVDNATQTLKSAIFAYYVANATESNILDVTSLIVNPNFDNGNTGWKWTTGASNTGTFTAETKTGLPSGYGDFRGGVWENWKNTKYKGKMYQTITGVPNGKYTLSASVFANKTWEEGTRIPYDTIYASDGVTIQEILYNIPPYKDWLFVYANDGKTVVSEPKLCKTYTVVGYANEGKLEIGINITDSVAQWFAVDNFKLSFQGYQIPAATTFLQGRVDYANTLISGYMYNSVLSELQAAIANANTVINNSPTQTTIESAVLRLQTAIASAENSVISYSTLLNTLSTVNTNKSNYISYTGYATLEVAIASAQNGYNNKLWDDATITAEISKLKVAEISCRLSQPAPFDATFALQNPDFEQGVYSTSFGGKTYNAPAGWSLDATYTGSIDSKKSTTAPSDGLNCYNIWATGITEVNLNQSILLPPGQYELSAMMRTEAAAANGTQMLYALVNEEPYNSNFYEFSLDILSTDWNTAAAWVPLTVSFSVLDQPTSVQLGAYASGDGTSTGGWFQIDKFSLKMNERFTGVNSLTEGGDISVHGLKGRIVVKTEQETDVRIYSITGQIIQTIRVNGEKYIPVSPGVYIVNHKKVVVQ